MVLATSFAFPGADFDFNKYAPKTAAPAPNTTEAAFQPDAPTSKAKVLVHADISNIEPLLRQPDVFDNDSGYQIIDSTEDIAEDGETAEGIPAESTRLTDPDQAPVLEEQEIRLSPPCNAYNAQLAAQHVQRLVTSVPAETTASEAKTVHADARELQKIIDSLIRIEAATKEIPDLVARAQSLFEETKGFTQLAKDDYVKSNQPNIANVPEANITNPPEQIRPGVDVKIELANTKVPEAEDIGVSEAKSTEPDAEESNYGPPTLMTEEHFSLNDIPIVENQESLEYREARRLVSIRRITNICETKVDDRWLTVAQIDGWTCTVPRRAFKEGELVLYFMNEAFLPASDKRFGNNARHQTFQGVLGHRITTQRFGGYPNKLEVQGRVFPLERFAEVNEEIKSVLALLPVMEPELGSHEGWAKEQTIALILGMYRKKDWATELKVLKWEEPGPVSEPAEFPKLGKVPTRLFKNTDIKHVEDCPNLFSKSKYNTIEYQESVKMDGSSMSVYFVKNSCRKYQDLNPLPQGQIGPNTVLASGRFGVCSKKLDLNELNTCNTGFWKVALLNELPRKLAKLNLNIAIQGEICGPGINQNREQLKEAQFFVYSMWDITMQRYISPRKVEEVASILELQHVPVLRYVKIPEIARNHAGLRQLANSREGEGLVYKCIADGRAFKVHSTKYKVRHNC